MCKFLGPQELCHLARTCSQMRELVAHEHKLWYVFYLRHRSINIDEYFCIFCFVFSDLRPKRGNIAKYVNQREH